MALIEVKKLSKYFPTETGMLHAVDEVDFQIEEGKTLGVVGGVLMQVVYNEK